MKERYITFENYNKQLIDISPNDIYDRYFKGEKQVFPKEPLPITWMEINLGIYEENIHRLQQYLGENVAIVAITKTDAYGHGIVPIVQRSFQAGVDKVAVKDAQEAAKIRNSGITGSTVCLYPANAIDTYPLVKHDIEMTVEDVDSINQIALVAKELGKKVKVHIQVETGMNRYGAKPEDILSLMNEVNKRETLEIEGIFTHFATAGDDQIFLEEQFDTFLDVLKVLQDNGIHVPSIHVGNSDAIVYLPDCWQQQSYKGIMDDSKIYVRPGRMLFGTRAGPIETQEIITAIVSHISSTQTIQKGSRVGYRNAFIAEKPMDIACIPVGWDNGYLIKDADILLHGKRRKILGLVASLAFSVENTGGCRKNDRVLLLGQDGSERITAEEIAQRNEMIVDQLWSILGSKIQRVYYE